MLKILPQLKYPITRKQFDPLMDSIVNLNVLDAGITEPEQRGIGIYLHKFDLFVKSGGKIDYRGLAGHERLKQDAAIFCGEGNPVATRHGDLAAAHLAIDFSDTAIRCIQYRLPIPPNTPHGLLENCEALTGLSVIDEKRIGLLLDMLGKKHVG